MILGRGWGVIEGFGTGIFNGVVCVRFFTGGGLQADHEKFLLWEAPIAES